MFIMAEYEDPFVSSIYKSDNYNPTKVPLLNTQTSLRDPCISTSEGGRIRGGGKVRGR